MLSDIEIANKAKLKHISEVALDALGIEEENLVPYGHHKAKVDLTYLAGLQDRPPGKLILMTAMSPTPAGEGKTTTTVGLTDALHGLGHRAVACLREPSMGPVFGMKGGAAGGGYAQVVPMSDINLHFTGDFAALAAAHNLLSALIDITSTTATSWASTSATSCGSGSSTSTTARCAKSSSGWAGSGAASRGRTASISWSPRS